jgi:hypothetical protein
MSSDSTSSSDQGLLRVAVGFDASRREQQLSFFQIGTDDDRILQAEPLARRTVGIVVTPVGF